MKLVRLACAILMILCAALVAQTLKNPAFEVASIRPAPAIEIADILTGKRSLGSYQTTIDGARVDMNQNICLTIN